MIKQLENLLKNNPDLNILGIRYFDGLDLFCTKEGNFKGKNLEESLEKYLQDEK